MFNNIIAHKTDWIFQRDFVGFKLFNLFISSQM